MPGLRGGIYGVVFIASIFSALRLLLGALEEVATGAILHILEVDWEVGKQRDTQIGSKT